MRLTAYIYFLSENVKVLCSVSKNGTVLKLRKTGNLGVYLEDESLYLQGCDIERQVAYKSELESGKAIYL